VIGRKAIWPALGLMAATALVPAAVFADDAAVERGRYLMAAGSCYACHTDTKNKGEPLAGGTAIKTPFGTFYGPNITPDPTYGIGRWSDADFIRALREGIAPDGRHFFPAFPYPSFTNITDSDARDLKAFIFSLKPVAKPSRPHDIGFPFSWRFLQIFWRWLYFSPGPFKPDPAKPGDWNRGAYLVQALGHCGECHTPRTLLGGVETGRAMAGAYNAAEKALIPNITPDPETGIGKWSEADIVTALKMGMLPDGDFVGSLMSDVVNEGTSKLSDADLKAMAIYLRSLPPIKNRPVKPADAGAAPK
jgi:mono/diheme cytochrome c family protein